MHIKKLKNKNIDLDHLLNRVHYLFFLTSGQCVIFDVDDNQIDDLQFEFVHGETNMWLLKLIAEHAEYIYKMERKTHKSLVCGM